MRVARTIAATDGGRNDDGGEAFGTVAEQHRQRQETKKDEDGTMHNPRTKKKKPSRPRLKPITCNDDDDDYDANSLSVSCARDLGFGSFMVTVPSSTTASHTTTAATTTLEKKVKDTSKDATIRDNADGIEIGASSSSSSLNDEIDTESYSKLAKQNSTISLTTSTTATTTNTTTTAAPITAKPKPVRQPNQQLLRRQSHHIITPKLQPKSTVFSSPETGGGDGNNSPPSLQKSPDYDDDGYDVFGFGLISASKEEKNKWTTNNATNDSSVSEVEVVEDNDEDEGEGGETTSDATFDNSSSSSPRIASRVVQGGRRGRQRRGGKHASRISSISLSRVTSADSYISDDSTTSSDHQQQPQPQPKYHFNDHCNHDPTTNDAYFNNREDLLIHGSSLSSSNTNNFLVLSRKNSLHTQTSSRSLTLHLMSSDRGDDDGTCNGDSITSMESSLAAPSNVESSYFVQARTLYRDQQQQQLQEDRANHPARSATAFSRLPYNANDVATQYNSHCGIEPLTTKPNRQLIAHTRPSPNPDHDVVELIFSHSEESGEGNLLHSTTTTGRTYNNAYVSSEENFEGIRSDIDADAQLKKSRVESLTPSSIDDLRSCFRRISSPGTDSVSPSPPPPFTSSNAFGRQPPIRNRHVDSVISHYHNIDDEGQRKLGGLLTVPTTSAASIRDSPFLTNLQMINSQASYGSVIHSLQGGICTSEEEVETQQQRSRHYSQSGKTLSSVRTPESKPTTSLAYSDKEGLACNDRRSITSNLDDWKEGKAIAEERTKKPKVYSFRWIMMMYITVLNMLSGWTCFSIAPFSEVAVDSLGIDPAYLVATFFAANFISSAFEPIILRRLGLRRAVLLGALLLMAGNMINGSTPGASKLDSFDARRANLGFIFAGLSGPLYQNTSAILITSWFPRKERRTATDVVLCGNQLGIICSFIFGSWLVRTSDDVLPYFHKLSVISMFVFVGAAMQLSDCPPTPPSGMARVIRGTVEQPLVAVVKLAPPSTFDESNEFIDTIATEYVTLLPAQMQEGMNSTTLLSYGSTDPFVTRPSFSERNYDVDGVSEANPASRVGDEPPHEAMSVHPGLQFYPSDFDSNFQPKNYLPPTSDDGAEPTITQTSRLNMEICDDQLWRALRACISREGFLPCLSAYASSKVVINSLSTFMCYFTLDVGIIGCTFQLTVLASSVLCRKLAGKTRLYYMIIGLIALGTLSLALCGANLDSEVSFTLNLLMVAVFVGPLQPLSTTLGYVLGIGFVSVLLAFSILMLRITFRVETVSPLSENTVLVTQLLLSNLLSAACIPVFKALRKASAPGPEFGYSFHFLVLLFPAFHLTAIYVASLKQQIKSPNQETSRASNSMLRPLTRDQPWQKKYPFLIPRTV